MADLIDPKLFEPRIIKPPSDIIMTCLLYTSNRIINLFPDIVNADAVRFLMTYKNQIRVAAAHYLFACMTLHTRFFLPFLTEKRHGKCVRQ